MFYVEFDFLIIGLFISLQFFPLHDQFFTFPNYCYYLVIFIDLRNLIVCLNSQYLYDFFIPQ